MNILGAGTYGKVYKIPITSTKSIVCKRQTQEYEFLDDVDLEVKIQEEFSRTRITFPFETTKHAVVPGFIGCSYRKKDTRLDGDRYYHIFSELLTGDL